MMGQIHLYQFHMFISFVTQHKRESPLHETLASNTAPLIGLHYLILMMFGQPTIYNAYQNGFNYTLSIYGRNLMKTGFEIMHILLKKNDN